MNTQQQKAIEQALDQSLADSELSNAEEKALRGIIEGLEGDRSALAFVRNRAFKKARSRIEAEPLGVLRWLERIDKMVDNTASPPKQGGSNTNTAVAFSPGEDGLGLIGREIRSARKTLDICVFTITDDRITRDIIDAHQKGITVRVVTDNDKQFDTGSDIARLERAGVPVRFDPDTDHMHHKFAIADQQRLITGSYNWTRGATRNHENVMALSDSALIAVFAKEFDKLWAKFRERR